MRSDPRPPLLPDDHVFVDESKHRGYRLAVTAVRPRDVAAIRRSMRELVRPGQRRLHCTRESDSSRRRILARIDELDVHTTVYLVRGRSDREARTRCLRRMTSDLVRAGVERVRLERDASHEAADRRIIRDELARLAPRRAVGYDHLASHEHEVLWISDAVAWAHQAGGDWRRRVARISSVIELDAGP